MDEPTAASHLLSKQGPALPEAIPVLTRIRKVVLLVTVDRKGGVCDVKPVWGPPELRKPARQIVKDHWRYRPFLVDWKPVVAQFPVTVIFLPPKRDPYWVAGAKYPESLVSMQFR